MSCRSWISLHWKSLVIAKNISVASRVEKVLDWSKYIILVNTVLDLTISTGDTENTLESRKTCEVERVKNTDSSFSDFFIILIVKGICYTLD